jgi:TonB family protein
MNKLTLLALLALTTGRALAQVPPPASLPQQPGPPTPGAPVYTYVEQMPQLPGGGGARAVSEAIAQRFHYPRKALRQGVGGRILMRFTVAATGQVENIRIAQGLRADCDSAAVQAVRELPRFEPGIQKGQPVAVNFTVPLNLRPPR